MKKELKKLYIKSMDPKEKEIYINLIDAYDNQLDIGSVDDRQLVGSFYYQLAKCSPLVDETHIKWLIESAKFEIFDAQSELIDYYLTKGDFDQVLYWNTRKRNHVERKFHIIDTFFEHLQKMVDENKKLKRENTKLLGAIEQEKFSKWFNGKI